MSEVLLLSRLKGLLGPVSREMMMKKQVLMPASS